MKLPYLKAFLISAVAFVGMVGCVDESDSFTETSVTDELTGAATPESLPTPAKLIFNEILANEPGSDPAGRFIEIVNVGGLTAALGGWTLTTSAGVSHVFATVTAIAAGKSLVVYGSAAGIPAGVVAVPASSGGLGLSRDGDTVALKSLGGNIIDSVTYPAAMAAADGVSMNRSPDASATGPFVLHTQLSTSPCSPGRRASGAAY
jgi:hypothetical protein